VGEKMYRSTGKYIPNSLKSLRSLEVGTVLTDEEGNFFQRAEHGNMLTIHVMWRSDDWETGFAPVELHRWPEYIGGRKLYLAEKIEK